MGEQNEIVYIARWYTSQPSICSLAYNKQSGSEPNCVACCSHVCRRKKNKAKQTKQNKAKQTKKNQTEGIAVAQTKSKDKKPLQGVESSYYLFHLH